MTQIEICAIGGYNEVGKNMTAIRYENEVVICDMGFYLPKIISLQEEEITRQDLTKDELIHLDAIPDDSLIEDWKPHVKAIVLSHCHLDHVGGVSSMVSDYDCPVIGSPYTLEVLKTIMKDDKVRINNKLQILNVNSTVKVSKNIKIEFINMTHSTLQAVMIAIHTPKGIIIYANDFKFDNHPILGKKPDYQRLRELGKKGVLALVVDSLYSDANMKTPSEKVAREMLKDVMLGTDNKGHAVIVTTFASHIARLSSVLDFGQKMKRKVVFMGRSMHKYISAAENINLIHFSKKAEIIGYSGEIKRKLKHIAKNRDKYLIVCTGNQGEPGSILDRMSSKDLPFELKPDDHVIFSCRTIPAPINKANRAVLEDKLIRTGVRIFTDIHVSGHAAREDHRDLINMLNPQHIIPAHGDVAKLTPLAELATSMGYVLGKTVHLMRDGQCLELE